MVVFARPEPEEPGLLTFRAPDKPADPSPERHRALERLLLAAAQADVAEHELASAKARYAKTPTTENLTALLGIAARALEKEVEFDDVWENVSKEWFHEPPAIV